MKGNNDIHKREIGRRRALWRLAGLRPGDDAARELVQTLDEIDQAETDDATLVMRIPDVGEVLVQVPVEPDASAVTLSGREHWLDSGCRRVLRARLA